MGAGGDVALGRAPGRDGDEIQMSRLTPAKGGEPRRRVGDPWLGLLMFPRELSVARRRTTVLLASLAAVFALTTFAIIPSARIFAILGPWLVLATHAAVMAAVLVRYWK
jgi:hypothetical protein